MKQTEKDIQEQDAVGAFLEFLADSGFVLDPKKPDAEERQKKAPDYSICNTQTGHRIAVEITGLHKSDQAGHDDKIWIETVGNLDRELSGKIKGHAMVFVPELNPTIPGLGDRQGRNAVRSRLITLLPALIEALPIPDSPRRFQDAEIPFEFEIHRRTAVGSWMAISRLVGQTQSLQEVVGYLKRILPGKDAKFIHPRFASAEHVILLVNQIPFLEDTLAQRALETLSQEICLRHTDRIFLVQFGFCEELCNPWKRKQGVVSGRGDR